MKHIGVVFTACLAVGLFLGACDGNLLLNQPSEYAVTGTPAVTLQPFPGAPVIDTPPGARLSRSGLQITISQAGAPANTTIHYTTDGSTPDSSSPVYSGPFQIFGRQTVTVQALSAAPGYLDSSVVSTPYNLHYPIYLATATQGLSISYDTAATWETKQAVDGLASDALSGVAVEGQTIYVASDAGVSISHDDGASWTTRTTADGLLSDDVVWIFADADNVYSAHEDGISISRDRGATWAGVTRSHMGLPTTAPVVDVSAYGDRIFVATQFEGMAISTDGGTSWAYHVFGVGAASYITNVVGTDQVILVSGLGEVRTSTDDGANWQSYRPGGANAFLTAGMTVENDGTAILYVGGRNIGGLHRSTDNGASWDIPSNRSFTGRFQIHAPLVYALDGYNQIRFQYSPTGQYWLSRPSAPGDGDITALAVPRG